MGLNDPCLLPGNLLHRIPQQGGVIQRNGGDNAYQGIHHVGSVQQSPDAHLQEHQLTPALQKIQQRNGIAALVFIIIYTASFMMSWGPICWVLISEIFPNTIRSQAVAVAVAAQWISNFLVSATFPSLSAWSVGGTYCIYALMSLASALFVWKWVPETKGKTLEEMSKLWRKNGD